MKTTTTAAFLIASAALAAGAPKTDKTLVSWVTPANTTQRGGSVITIQSGDQFDGIVLGELQAGKWMAGSNFHQRTEKSQDKYPRETADSQTLVQVAAVYQGTAIRLYRNGELYASHQATNIDLLSPKNSITVFGLRHVGAGGGWFAGTIDDARIYGRALTEDEIKALRPNEKSEIKPFAWWDFNGDRIIDRAGRFPHSHAQGGAKLVDGRLALAGQAVVVAAATEQAAKVDVRQRGARPPAGPYVTETPAMPEAVPDNWLTYHLAHPGPGVGFPGDPNCAFHYKGRYHLHYIYKNKHGFAFAHVSSKDMVRWKWHPTVLIGPNTGHGMFSGTGFLTKDGQPAIIYHGQGSGRNHLAFALDEHLDKWTKPVAIRPTNPDGSEPAMRHWDPDCWLNGDTYYALSGGKDPELLKSADLENWTHLGKVLHDDMPDIGVARDEDISCANMFRIGERWMLLCISHRLGCRYYLGDFKDEKYLPGFHAMMNWNKWDFFAPESLLTPDGRRVMWAWCNMPGAQTAIQSLPRELSLPEDGVLRINPLRELEKLRHDEKSAGPVTVKSGGTHTLDGIAGDTVELRVAIKPTDAKTFGINVFCDDDGNGFPITIVPGDKVLTMGTIKPPFALKDGEDLDLRVFLDKGMVEVFVNERQAAVAMHAHDKKDVGISLFSNGGSIEATVQAWKMKSIYAEK
jgi:sucrose-6-phosphate hydrolase SacC (GH32 family)